MYDPKHIEEKWQAWWAEHRTNEPDLDAASSPFFNLMMFPYPSAEGLHVGNMFAFTGADLHGRYQRLLGRDVFQPIGFDAFGIHSENFALKENIHPTTLIPRNIVNFTRQLKNTGIMYDWSRTVDTTDPDYYRWTQWIFLKLYDAGLAEKKEAPVNWCPSCKTVLANEQVIAGECERCATKVEQRMLSQWFFKITDYAERLLAGLDHIDWSATTVTAQRNWIGRSEGAQLRFPVARATADEGEHEPAQLERKREMIEVFTTRPDTVFGATFMVLAPEHPLVEKLTTREQAASVEAYRAETAALDLIERQKSDDRGKTGVFTGGYANNPATGESIPVWIADYVLMGYGTGAIMAVPGHDQRDFEFATEHGLEIVQVVAPAGEAEAAEVSGAEVSGEPYENAFSYAGDDQATADDQATVAGGGATVGDPPEAAFTEHSENEVLINSGEFNGRPATEGATAIVEWLAERGLAEARTNYRLHDWCISRQRYWGPPIPIIYCDACGVVPVPEKDLPVILPYVEDFKPGDDGIAPLAKDSTFYEVPCPECGEPARRETDVSDTFLDSSWYFLRYPSTDTDDAPFAEGRTERWLPVDMYIGGEEHAVLHLLYSRFITMVLYDLGHIGFEEPYDKFRKHGLLIRDGSKMSKSRGNVVIPDEYLDRFGADTFRAYLMFLGPYEEGGDFRGEAIMGPYRFLSRAFDAVEAAVEAGETGFPDAGVERVLHATIKQVTEDFARLSFNTAIAALMELLNAIRASGRTPTLDEVRPMAVMLGPIAPHTAEEMWTLLGSAPSLFDTAEWPGYDASKLVTDTVDLPVQVNGKLRAMLQAARGASTDEVKAAAMADEGVQRHLEGVELVKTIHVPDRLLNLVVK